MATIEVEWTPAAQAQYQTLDAHQKEICAWMVDQILADPGVGWELRDGKHEGKTVYVRVFPGYEVIVEFFRWGFFWRNLTIWIVAVRPMDYLTSDDYDQRQIDRGPRKRR